MTTYLGKSCSFCLPRVPFINCRQFMYLVISLLVLRAGYGIWLYQFLIIAYLFTLHISIKQFDTRLSNFDLRRRYYELISKFSVGLKTLLHQGLSEPEFYGDLVYKFKKIVGRADFSDQFRKIIVRYKRIGYNINIMRQSACLVFNPITVNNFASLFNCTPVGRASDSMMAPT